VCWGMAAAQQYARLFTPFELQNDRADITVGMNSKFGGQEAGSMRSMRTTFHRIMTIPLLSCATKRELKSTLPRYVGWDLSPFDSQGAMWHKNTGV
jgi:hypothetical protein